MAMIRCPICGEKFSDTYRHCPFCEEEEALRQGEQIRRNVNRGGKRSAHRRQQPSLLSPLLVLLILILAALLVYLLFGDKLAQTLFGQSASQQVEETLDQTEDGDVTMPEVDGMEDPDAETEPEGTETTDPSQADPSTLPETLTIAYLGNPKEEFTMTVGDDPIPLTASGGTGTYTWSSSDDGIVSVDAEGKVTAISAGQATLTVSDGTGKGTCVVIVKAGTSTGTSSGGSTDASGSSGTLKAGAAVVVNGGGGVFVRSGPGTSYEALATVSNGDSIQIVESAGDGWYKITFSGIGGATTTGYMKGDYLANQ